MSPPGSLPGLGHSRERLHGRGGRVAATLAAVAYFVQKAAGVELVEELDVAGLVEVAAIAECGHHRPASGFVHDVPRAEFEQDRPVAVVAEQFTREPVGQSADVVFAVCCAAFDLLDEEMCVLVTAEEVPGVEVAFPPGLAGTLDKLPVVETRAEAACDRLRVSGAIVMAEAVVGEAQGLGEHPAFAVVLGEEGFDALFTVATSGLDLRLEVGKRNARENGVPQFGSLFSADTPEALGRLSSGVCSGVIAVDQYMPEVRRRQSEESGGDRIGLHSKAKSLCGGAWVKLGSLPVLLIRRSKRLGIRPRCDTQVGRTDRSVTRTEG